MDLKIFGWAVVCCLPLAVTIFIIYRQRKKQREYSRAPFNELQRRPAGETLRCKLEELDDKINDESTMLVLFPVIMVMGLFVRHPQDWTAPLTFLVISAGTAALFGVRLARLLRTRAN